MSASTMIRSQEQWDASAERSDLFCQAYLMAELEDWEAKPDRSELFTSCAHVVTRHEWTVSSECLRSLALAKQEAWENSLERSEAFDATQFDIVQDEWEACPARTDIFKSSALEAAQDEWESIPERSNLFEISSLDVEQDEWEDLPERSDLFKCAALEAELEEWGASSERSELFTNISERSVSRENRRAKKTIHAQYITLLLAVSHMFRENFLTKEGRGELKQAIIDRQPIVLSALQAWELRSDGKKFLRSLQEIAECRLRARASPAYNPPPLKTLQQIMECVDRAAFVAAHEAWEAGVERSPLLQSMREPLVLSKLSPAMGRLVVEIQHSPQGVGDFAWIGENPGSPKRRIVSMPVLELASTV
jgi:hypothetical protein